VVKDNRLVLFTVLIQGIEDYQPGGVAGSRQGVGGGSVR